MFDHWTSNDARSGPRQVAVLETTAGRSLVRHMTGREEWILSKHLHTTRQQAYVAGRRSRALHFWTARLRLETRA